MKLITSEAVSMGHPDKVADQISDAMLDACLRQDEKSRVAVETMVTTNTVFMAGEVTTHADVDISSLVCNLVKNIGYDFGGFDYNNLTITSHIHRQSPDIALGVDRDGAGDQGMMYGYACNDRSTNYLPVQYYYAQSLVRMFQHWRVSDEDNGWFKTNLRPDAKTQITYDSDAKKMKTIVISHQHVDGMDMDEFKQASLKLIHDAIPKDFLDEIVFLKHDDPYDIGDDKTFVFLNPTGKFVEGGPAADTGLTGRKIIVDTYGGEGRIGGGAFSGKDPSKVDRSAAYMCRHVAKHLVMKGLCKKAEVAVAYAIGVAHPVQIVVDTFGTGDDAALTEYVIKNYDFRPRAIIERFSLTKPELLLWNYEYTARNGHFTQMTFPWERVEN